jgi:integrase
MGTITTRKRRNGTTGFTAQIRLKQNGKVIWTEAQTFDRRQAAAAWLEKRERELAKPGAVDRIKAADPTLAEVIDRSLQESVRGAGKTKRQVLEKVKKFAIASMRCSEIGSPAIVSFGAELLAGVDPDAKPLDDGSVPPLKPRKPQTVQNYLSHLSSIFAIARPAWGYPLETRAMEDALSVLRRLGTVRKSGKRDRRPTLDELDRLMQHYTRQRQFHPDAVDMMRVIAFAIFSTRRQEEITRIVRSDIDRAASTIIVRDMKHPGDKIGNDVRCELTPEALAIIDAMPAGDVIFPYSTDAISASFTRACKLLRIEDLHFHDLRHVGVSRLFEMGRTLPQAASVSGHRSWASLQRYTHLRQTGDKFAGWTWLPIVTRKPE